MTSPLLEVNGLAKHYPVRKGLILAKQVGTVRAVDGVSFSLNRGETLALVGESGCGKSTTARLVLRLIEPSAGTLRFDGQDISSIGGAALRAMRRRMQIVFQDPYASLNPRLTVAETIAEPMQVHGIGDAASRRKRVEELLSLVGLRSFHAQRYPHEFSGGQRQRIGIARALAVQPDLVVCDEPVSALDVSIQAQVVAAAVGETAARQMLLEAAIFTAADMLGRGFLSRVVPDDDVPTEALASARRIAALAPGAARMNKQVLRALKMPPALDGKAPAAIERIVNGPHDPYAYADSAEHREGITAFLAKRPPVF